MKQKERDGGSEGEIEGGRKEELERERTNLGEEKSVRENTCIYKVLLHNAISEIDVCESDPCKNGANCSRAEDKYICNCVPGYTGLTCDTGSYKCFQ